MINAPPLLRAIILAAGRGSRMKALTREKPKCLVSVRGKSLIDWQLETFHECDIQDIAIVTGYKKNHLTNRGLVEFHNQHWENTNMVCSLQCASSWLENYPCIVTYSDIFFEPSAVKLLLSSTSSIAITYDPNWLSLWQRRFEDPLVDAETFRVSDNQTLLEIGNRPSNLDTIQGQYMGLLSFTPKGWCEMFNMISSLKDYNVKSMHMTDALQKLIELNRISIHALPYFGEWGEIDSVSDLSVYQ
ncbi:Hypothetical protein P9303_29421 [Prochlorococcus marinus str. MIT 9303]|uniref:MobA-like NTP transferase domain-containing protein n=1 Tax=Prochlorococcus marinus (strain MIT 9303) TaxID=59922 RepID=A2CDW2_PROM3|nr:Hypothetical protein P9303_29421 [Prochlorococcus marinus str. MIT 9303]